MTTRNELERNHPFLYGTSLEWKICTPAFLQEVFGSYPGKGGVLFQPANIFRELIAEVAQRATEINDPILNALMCRMALYSVSDPYDKEFNHDITQKTINHPEYIKYKQKKIKI